MDWKLQCLHIFILKKMNRPNVPAEVLLSSNFTWEEFAEREQLVHHSSLDVLHRTAWHSLCDEEKLS